MHHKLSLISEREAQACESAKLRTTAICVDGQFIMIYIHSNYPKGPCTAHLRTLGPKTTPGIVFGTRVLKWAVYGPLGP